MGFKIILKNMMKKEDESNLIMFAELHKEGRYSEIFNCNEINEDSISLAFLYLDKDVTCFTDENSESHEIDIFNFLPLDIIINNSFHSIRIYNILSIVNEKYIDFYKKNNENRIKLSNFDYILQNKLDVTTALCFTGNDLNFIRREKLKKIIINGSKETKETLTEKDILIRLDYLKNRGKNGKN